MTMLDTVFVLALWTIASGFDAWRILRRARSAGVERKAEGHLTVHLVAVAVVELLLIWAVYSYGVHGKYLTLVWVSIGMIWISTRELASYFIVFYSCSQGNGG